MPKSAFKKSKTLKDYHVHKFHRDLTVPAGSIVDNRTAMGPDDAYHWWSDYHAALTKYEADMGRPPGFLLSEMEQHGIRVPAELCEPYPND